jgi:hypothetical protein
VVNRLMDVLIHILGLDWVEVNSMIRGTLNG